MQEKIDESNRFVFVPTEAEIARSKARQAEQRAHPELYPELTEAEGRRRHLIRLTEEGLYDGPIPDPEPQYADKTKAA